MSLDRIITDPIISTENTAFNSPSHCTPPVENIFDQPATSEQTLPTERDHLVAPKKVKKPFYRARPLWLVPFALATSLTRGMTLASRVEVFTELSCNQLRDPYKHTSVLIDSSMLGLRPTHHPPDAQAQPSIPLFFPTSSTISFFEESKGDGVNEGNDPRVIPGDKDLIFILVSTPNSPLASHSHKLLVLAPVIEGFLGGWSALTSAQSAYITDCTSSGSRATIFARFSGVLFVGLALGPILGAWLIKNPINFLRVGTSDHPLQSVNSVFWNLFRHSRRAANRKGKNRAVETSENDNGSDGQYGWYISASNHVRETSAAGILSPLAVFLPTAIPVAARVTGEGQVRIRRRKDWGLTLLATSLTLHMLASGLFQLKYLYAEHVYDWVPSVLVTSFSSCHFSWCTFKPVRSAISAAAFPPVKPNGKPVPTVSQLLADIRFDLVVLRCSMIAEFFSHCRQSSLHPFLRMIASSAWWSELFFVGATSLACARALRSARSMDALWLRRRQRALVRGSDTAYSDYDAVPEPGKLLGALAVLQAAGSTILVYSTTVASFPRTIFVVAAGLILLSVTLTFFIRVPGRVAKRRKTATIQAPVHITSKKARQWYEEENRGRSRVSKDLRGGAASPLYGATNNTFGVTSHHDGSAQAGPSSSRLQRWGG
ncbi:hypothetical protein EDC04DRAFT_2600844 [Pisolithus marmoratus]|nr:hypothetical protein EDC04DRAFT_2600844 [Pisolithus marmoratus]